jgi:hypothetical protein
MTRAQRARAAAATITPATVAGLVLHSMWLCLRSLRHRDWCGPALSHLDFTLGGHHMSEDGYSLLEALFVLSILLVISGIGA